MAITSVRPVFARKILYHQPRRANNDKSVNCEYSRVGLELVVLVSGRVSVSALWWSEKNQYRLLLLAALRHGQRHFCALFDASHVPSPSERLFHEDRSPGQSRRQSPRISVHYSSLNPVHVTRPSSGHPSNRPGTEQSVSVPILKTLHTPSN